MVRIHILYKLYNDINEELFIKYIIHNIYIYYYRNQKFRVRVSAMTSVVRRLLKNDRATSLICNIIVLYFIARHVILLLWVLLTQRAGDVRTISDFPFLHFPRW